MTRKRNKPTPVVRDDRASQESVLAVLVDIDNGHEYYMSFIDAFQYKGREYVVMYPYEPDDGQHKNPELTILRSMRHENGEQYYLSIKNRRELEAAFNHFFKRFEASGFSS
ncbi:MAG: DUF1292 domain-containing protein [Clostridiaceae bacterium]|jgi:uncharacterized protein YrzB (UPF0473 family)|nr:DUF1292 domain-containing protein [Eubacteriales bacterium]NLV48615.1 DUF1292 domain-containing protein [Clostridiaceae bacterium]